MANPTRTEKALIKKFFILGQPSGPRIAPSVSDSDIAKLIKHGLVDDRFGQPEITKYGRDVADNKI